jgi:hypothetical protein
VTPPKLFISYSWTNPENKEWVVGLATQLRSRGVDVVLDEWDAPPGTDLNRFMERVVTDSEVKKVIMVVDRHYVEKADARRSGVGTEAQIISSEVYGKTDQTKFVAVVIEKMQMVLCVYLFFTVVVGI